MNPTPRPLEDLNAERALLGAVIADNSVIPDAAELVSPDDFANPAHGQIFAAMLALDNKSNRVDPVTLAEELKILGHLASAGGVPYLTQLDQSISFGFNAVEYARIVKDRSVRRGLAEVGRQIMDMATAESGSVEELVDESERKVFNIAQKKRSGELVPMNELVEPALANIEKMRSNETGITGITSGFPDLDRQLTGFHGGELIILAARPGIGKTSLAMNFALNACKETGRSVAVFSLEMPNTQLVERLLATQARIDVAKLRGGGKLTQNDMDRLGEAGAELFGLKMYVDDSGALSSFDLRAKARRLKQREDDLCMIVIDYLQLMHQKGKVESRQLEVAEISRALKQLAKELDLPIIALSQLNRKVEERKDGKPMLSDLRESGAIEQDADVVMFIHRDEQGEDGAPPPPSSKMAIPVELIIAKQRNGPVGSVDLMFLSSYTRFESKAPGFREDGQ